MSRLLKLRKNKKGFTLVEVVVVLVILAILAAILIPSLTGYVDKAKQKAVIAEARSAVLAAQTLASEAYATGGSDPTVAQIEALAEVDGVSETSGDVAFSSGKLTKLVYDDGDYTVTYTAASGFGAPVKS